MVPMKPLLLDQPPPHSGWPCTLHEGLTNIAKCLSYVEQYDPAHEYGDVYQNGYVFMCRYPATPYWALKKRLTTAKDRTGMMFHFNRGLPSDKTNTTSDSRSVFDLMPTHDNGPDYVDCDDMIEWLIQTYGPRTTNAENNRNRLRVWYNDYLHQNNDDSLSQLVWRFRRHAREQYKKELER